MYESTQPSFLKFPWDDDTRYTALLQHFEAALKKWKGESDATWSSRKQDLKDLLDKYTKVHWEVFHNLI